MYCSLLFVTCDIFKQILFFYNTIIVLLPNNDDSSFDFGDLPLLLFSFPFLSSELLELYHDDVPEQCLSKHQ